MEVKLVDEQKKKIEQFVKQGRFESIDDFIRQAVKLLLYAEDKKDEFQNILKQK